MKFNLYDRVKVITTGGEGMIIAVYDNDEYRTDIDGMRSESELVHNGKHSFSVDMHYPFDKIIDKCPQWVKAKKDAVNKLIGNGITTGCVPNKTNLKKVIALLGEGAYIDDLVRIGNMVQLGLYEHEFKYTYHTVFSHQRSSTTGEYFSMIRQILNYNN